MTYLLTDQAQISRARRNALGKTLCYLLRHDKEAITNKECPGAWFDIEDVLIAINKIDRLKDVTKEDINSYINSAIRFERKGSQIRACYGHSFPYELIDSSQEPPMILYHGTINERMTSISIEGIKPMNRHLVHLSTNRESARQVAQRHSELTGSPIRIISINADYMYKAGYLFYPTKPNTVWLTREVPSKYFIASTNNLK